jgi:predicted RNA-binding Zn-ribbon protein involved in translation (DUF1610 family)
MGRRGIKEYRASEALQLILADRDHGELVCPSCGGTHIERTPRRRLRGVRREAPYRRVILRCEKCGRQAAYVPKNVTQPSEADAELIPVS